MRTRLEPPKQCQVRFILDVSAPWQVNSFFNICELIFLCTYSFFFFKKIFSDYAVTVSKFSELFSSAATVFLPELILHKYSCGRVQVDVSDVRLLRFSTRLVLAMNSMDVGHREGARDVIDTAARHAEAGRAWDRAYRQICVESGIGHAVNVTPESEVYRFGNGGLLTSTERVTVLVVLADHLLLLSYSVVESPVLSLLIGRDVVEGLGLDIKGSSKTLE